MAPDAAGLISHGDGLVYTKHKINPNLANFLQSQYQDKLRIKWSKVMNEIDTKRNIAIKAEDELKEFNSLYQTLQKWLDNMKMEMETSNNFDMHSVALRSEFKAKEADVLKLNDIGKSLKSQRIGFHEKYLTETNADWIKVAEAYTAICSPLKEKDKSGKNVRLLPIIFHFKYVGINHLIILQEALQQKASEFVTKINKARETVSLVSRHLNSTPLNGMDFDDFPQQEDALVVRKSMAIFK